MKTVYGEIICCVVGIGVVLQCCVVVVAEIYMCFTSREKLKLVLFYTPNTIPKSLLLI